MAKGISDQSLRPKNSAEISIDSMIGAPLVAASRANAEMMLGQTNFVLRNCFVKKEGLNKYDPIMIEMSLTKAIPNHDKLPSDSDYLSQQTIRFQVPLFCLIPMNSLAIDKITVDFDMEITSSTSYQIPKEEMEKTGNRVMQNQAQLNGKIKSDTNEKGQYTRDSTSKLKVHVNASPLPLSLGLLTLLDLYSKNINPSQTEKNE
ncbi:MAG: hypothetical protein ACJAY8_000185 [Sphingobacteriales bacterium]|jgi:hypothetical protein